MCEIALLFRVLLGLFGSPETMQNLSQIAYVVFFTFRNAAYSVFGLPAIAQTVQNLGIVT
jgi:hypothetical protein